MSIHRVYLPAIILLIPLLCAGQAPDDAKSVPQAVGLVWSADNGDGTFTNPVLHADYSDPDAIRVGEDYYLTSSSFAHWPGLPILHSRDLVNWQIIGHAAPQHPNPDFDKPQHGMGIWAPSIRFHNGEFYIYYGDPDRGVFMTKAKNPAGPWEPLRLIRKVIGWIDTCPFWDDDGNAYLVHAFANSRVGIKSILVMNRMNPEGTGILDDGTVVFVGHVKHPTMEGPKLHKRNGYYYIFAPAGGVKPGWQTVLRSKNIFGPYEDKIVLEQGSTAVNGPHQGAWVDTPSGEDWFLHFQDRYAYGRIVHLQPMRWENDWPVIGVDYDRNGVGEPVPSWKKPDVASPSRPVEPQTSDEFTSTSLGLQWQWNGNPNNAWYSLSAKPGSIRLFAAAPGRSARSLWSFPSLMLQKFPAPSFSATVQCDFLPISVGERAGLVIFGLDYAYVGVERVSNGLQVVQRLCQKADKGSSEQIIDSVSVLGSSVTFRVEVNPENLVDVIPKILCSFSYSTDGTTFRPIGKAFVARESIWAGAKVGLFASARSGETKSGYVDVDWFRVCKSGL
jgi:beta-xylosidase